MNPERWQQVKEIFGAALEREPGERAAFVEKACAGDEGLRREVESLLAADGEETGLLGEPLAGLAAELLGGQAGSHAGRTFGPYRVEHELGRGGMGVVYLARDTRLGRPVAIKLLPPSYTSEPERVARFEREAQAVSHLNHPHIVTVYEVGEADGLRYLVTEYVEGETLRELLGRGLLPLERALDIAAQVASALVAAHEAGVVHRDIKPENVVVRPDGYVKVLDFGLAKLTEAAGDGSGRAQASQRLSTQPGLVMGTVSYMSPEQARGLRVDERTDVWSLGVVLYEMLAGCAPFAGETVSHVIVNILEREPELLERHAPGAPEQLRQLVARALTKDREGRHASMRDMLEELREAREEVTFRARQELHLSAGGGTARASTADASLARNAPRRDRAWLWGAVAALTALALAFGAYLYTKGRRDAPAPPTAKMNRITASGKIFQVALSPGGKYLAYAAGSHIQHSLWVMQTGTRSHTQLVPPVEGMAYLGLTFSPDGDYIYFVKAEVPGALYRIPTLGGTPKRLLTGIESAVTFSPDGGRIAYLRALLNEGVTQVVLANADGTGERVLAARKEPDHFFCQDIVKISWSPDGETIACPAGNLALPVDRSMEVVGVSTKDGSQRPLMRDRVMEVRQVQWLGDGSGLIMAAKDRLSSPGLVWYLSYPEGEARALTNDFSRNTDISVDGDTIAAAPEDVSANILVAPAGDAARARQITDGRLEGYQGHAWTPDGRIVYCSYVSGNADIWVMDADGGNRRRLTEDEAFDGFPQVSSDGRYIVFVSARAGETLNLWRMEIDGGNPVQLTRGSGETWPRFTPDGHGVFYSASGVWWRPGPVWKVPLEGGEAVLFNEKAMATVSTSPDRRWVAYSYLDARAEPPMGIAVAPADGGPPVRRFEARFSYDWTPDGRALAYVDSRLLDLWAQPLDGGQPRPLTDFKTGVTWDFAYARDGKQLSLVRGSVTKDVVLITDFR